MGSRYFFCCVDLTCRNTWFGQGQLQPIAAEFLHPCVSGIPETVERIPVIQVQSKAQLQRRKQKLSEAVAVPCFCALGDLQLCKTHLFLRQNNRQPAIFSFGQEQGIFRGHFQHFPEAAAYFLVAQSQIMHAVRFQQGVCHNSKMRLGSILQRLPDSQRQGIRQ